MNIENKIALAKKNIVDFLTSTDFFELESKKEELEDLLFDLEMLFYENDLNEISIDLGSGFSGYKMIDNNMIDETEPPKEIVENSSHTSQVFTSIYKTYTQLLYFVKKEFFNHELDEDSVRYYLVFTKDAIKALK